MRKLLWVLVFLSFLTLMAATLGRGAFLSSFVRTQDTAMAELLAGSNRLLVPFVFKNYPQDIPLFGAQMSNLNEAGGLSQAVEAGIKWVRVSLAWRTIEPTNTTPDQFQWSQYDEWFSKAAKAGLTPLVIISDNPTWAAPASCGPVFPQSQGEFRSFLTALVERYSKPPYNVRYWELYNEPDNYDAVNYAWLGGCWGNQGGEYAQMLKTVYPLIKGIDPEAKVVMGSIAHDWFTTECGGGYTSCGPFVQGFLDAVIDPFRGNAGSYFDIFAFHYYPAFRQKWDPFGPELIGKTQYLRDKLSSYGLSKPIIITEISMWTSGKHGGSDEIQSNYVAQAYSRGMAAGLVALIWFPLVDYEDEWQYALLKRDLNPKPSYGAYVIATRELAQAYFKRRLDAGSAVEGYVFGIKGEQAEKMVLWANGGDTQASFTGSAATVTDKLGQARVVRDNDDGRVDGNVTVQVTSSPIYLRVAP